MSAVYLPFFAIGAISPGTAVRVCPDCSSVYHPTKEWQIAETGESLGASDVPEVQDGNMKAVTAYNAEKTKS